VSDNVGNQVTYTSANVAKVDTVHPQVTAIASQSGTTVGMLENNDKLILTFSKSLATASVPSSFAGATEAQAGGPAHTTLTIPGFTNGALDTGNKAYVTTSTTATFDGTVVLVNSGATTTVTITVTNVSGGPPKASSGALIFTPASTITDLGGNAATGTFTTAAAFALF
jgi:hypothetical protein